MASASPVNFDDVWPAVQDQVTFVHFNRPSENAAALANNETIWNWINGTGEYAGNEGVLLLSPEGESTADFSQTSGILNHMGITGYAGNLTWFLTTDLDNRVMKYLTVTGPFSDQTTPATWVEEGTSSYMDLGSVQAIDEAVPVLVNGAYYCGLMIDPKRRIVVKTDSEMVRQQTEMNGVVRNVQAWMINAAQYGSHFSEYFWDSERVLMETPQPQP